MAHFAGKEALPAFDSDLRSLVHRLLTRAFDREKDSAHAFLNAEEGPLLEFLDAMPIGVFVVNAKGEPCYTNTLGLRIFGQSRVTEGAKRKLGHCDIAPRIFHRSTNKVYQVDEYPIARALRAPGEEISDEDLVVNVDGVTRYLDVRARAVTNDKGAVSYAVAAFVDISERVRAFESLVESRRKVDFLLRNLSDAIYIFEASGGLVEVNQAACESLGYSREELLAGGLEGLVEESDFSDRAIFDRVGRGDYVVQRGFHLRRDGSRFPVETKLFRCRYNEKDCVLVVSRDVTVEEEKKERLLRYREQRLKAQEEERRRIAREIHDEWGSALMSLRVGLSELRQGRPDEQPQITHLEETIQQLTADVGRMAKSLYPLALEELGLKAALEERVKTLSELHGLDARCFVLWTPEEADVSSNTAIYRLVQEGLTNVVKHAQADTVCVTLARDEQEIRLFIEDDGIGFDSEGVVSERCLGLRAMNERAELLGGTLSIDRSPRGKGTELLVRFPLP